ncbi:hypothetical protein BaRGS_00024148 [Batillaria attramentaria]|uniref:Uncharacterized protein n=1 Tax=Batillaria attramentaria TaxID=370345 RepID=A0ABD0KC42_9CAEN
MTGCCHTRRTFHLIQRRSTGQYPLVQFQLFRVQVYGVRGLGNHQLETRNLSRYCPACLGAAAEECSNAFFVGEWENCHHEVFSGDASCQQ